jgi:hypothetical protein
MREVLAGALSLINDPTEQEWLPAADLVRDHVQRLALTPITAKGSVVGPVGRHPHAGRRGRASTSASSACSRQIASQAAIAIENGRLFDGLAASEAS